MPNDPYIESVEERVVREDTESFNLIQLSAKDEAEARQLGIQNYQEEQNAIKELADAEAEYNNSLQELLTAEEYAATLKTDAEIDEAAQRDYQAFEAAKNGIIESSEQEEYQKQLAAWNAEQAATAAQRNNFLHTGTEQQQLGLLRSDATNEEIEEAGKLVMTLAPLQAAAEEGFLKQRDPLFATRFAKHKALIKAHNSFQAIYKDDILNYRYSKPTYKKAIENNPTYNQPYYLLKEYRSYYDAWYARNGHIFRSYYQLLNPFQAIEAKDGLEENAPLNMLYVWNGAEWVQQGNRYFSGIWKYKWFTDKEKYKGLNYGITTPNPDPFSPLSTPANSLVGETSTAGGTEFIYFRRDGILVSPFVQMPNDYQTVQEKPDVMYAYFAQKGFKQGRYNRKRAYEPCAKGYWFYETLPEEASQCVYMSGVMVDDEASYYPASVGLSYGFREGNGNVIAFPISTPQKPLEPLISEPGLIRRPEEDFPEEAGGMFA